MFNRKLATCLVALVLAVMPCLAAAQTVDLVNDDTDLFMANPTIDTPDPNVLIVLDNTANWTGAFPNEMAALASVVSSLDDGFNVGLMWFTDSTTAEAGPQIRGAWPMFAMRPTETYKNDLAAMVSSFDVNNEKGDGVYLSLTMYEAWAYLTGGTARAGTNQTKRDYGGNPLNAAGALPLNAFTDAADDTYNLPGTDICSKNYIIYISNGPANENASSLTEARDLLAGIGGDTTQIPVPENGAVAEVQWADEYTRFMASTDLDNDSTNGVQNVRTYTVEIDPNAGNSTGLENTALLKSMAKQGTGKYFGVSSGGGGNQITDSLQAIFNEIQGVNSVFAATTLPVSVNVRGTNLNQIYIGMFRPDEQRDPRWMGNVKLYQFAYDSTTDTVFLADSQDPPQGAENKAKGFITPNAVSFWTESSTYWGFRSPVENSAGGSSDSPDGEVVEKGGVAQQARLAYATDQTTRKLYTCTGCANGDVLGAAIDTLFDTSNTNITGATLDLGTRVVDPLTGYDGKKVVALFDRLPIDSLSNASGATVSVSKLANGSTTVDVTSLSTSTSKVVTNLDASTPPDGTLVDMAPSGGSYVFRMTAPFPLVAGDTVYVENNSCPEANGVPHTVTGYVDLGLPNVWFTVKKSTIVCSTWDPYTGGVFYKGVLPGASITARATVLNHGYNSGDQITISGASPNDFNVVNKTITKVDANTFTYLLASAQGAATVAGGFSSILASTETNIAKAILSVSLPGLKQGDNVSVSGASPGGYNGTFAVSCVPAQGVGTTCGSDTQFSYDVGAPLLENTGTSVKALTGGSTTAVVTAPAHGFLGGDSTTISGALPSGWNGTYVIAYVDANTFTISTASVLPSPATGTITAYSALATGPTVVATSPDHGFSVGQTIYIEYDLTAAHNGTWVIATVPDADTFTYSTGATLPSPGGGSTVRPAAGPRAYAWVAAHGYTTGDQVFIDGADPVDYNGLHTIDVIDANRFSYALPSDPDPDGFGGLAGLNISATVNALVKTNIARAQSIAHGFTTGDAVTITGATPSDFNGNVTVTVVDSNLFYYTIPSGTKQGNATGAIRASVGTVSSAAVDDLINWVRGEDNFEDENSDAAYTDVRSSIHGDVLHSRPAVINYNRFQSDTVNIDNDVYVFYGGNDGVFRAIKGGKGSSSGEPKAGTEVWGFVAEEHFTGLTRLRKNFPPISSSNKKTYFFDGNTSAYALDSDLDGEYSAVGDKVYIYAGMRRGGRALYAFDALDPEAPKYMWKINNATTGFAELGQTWSEAKVVKQIAGSTDPVLVFGAGWDPNVEDIPTDLITTVTASSVTTLTGTTPRTMGRGIYIVNARTGALIWRALNATAAAADPVGGATTLIVPGMDCSIPSDIAVIKPHDSLYRTRGYVGDTCGNLWRIDYGDASPANWSVTKIAAVGDWSTTAGRRKILYPPDVVFADSYYALLVGTGDREHPFDASVENRFYMFKDHGLIGNPVTANASTVPALSPVGTNAVLGETDLFDITDNCIQDASGCPSGVTQADAEASLTAADGWYLVLGTGEKSVGTAVTIAGTTFFGTNQPSTASTLGACESDLGIARAYQISFLNGSAAFEQDGVAGISANDRFGVVPGGGFLPSAVSSTVQLGGVDSDGDGIYEVAPVTKTPVCLGTRCVDAPGNTLQTRVRSFWYKEID